MSAFIIQMALMDIEIDQLKEETPNIILKATTTKEHIAEIEKRIQAMNEWAWGIINALSFTILPKWITT